MSGKPKNLAKKLTEHIIQNFSILLVIKKVQNFKN